MDSSSLRLAALSPKPVKRPLGPDSFLLRRYAIASMSPRTKVALVAEILAAYALTRWRLPRTNLDRLLALIRRSRATRTQLPDLGCAEATLVASRLGAAVRRTLRVLPTDSPCLTEALVLCSLLSARGIPNVVVIGARPTPKFAAHAWVECGGRAVLPAHEFDEYRLLEL